MAVSRVFVSYSHDDQAQRRPIPVLRNVLFVLSVSMLQGCVGPVLTPEVTTLRIKKDFESGITYTAAAGSTVYREADATTAQGVILTQGFDRYTINGNYKVKKNAILTRQRAAQTGQVYYCTRNVAVFGIVNNEVGPACFLDINQDGSFDKAYFKDPKNANRVGSAANLNPPIAYSISNVSLSEIGMEYIVIFEGAQRDKLLFRIELRDHLSGCLLEETAQSFSYESGFPVKGYLTPPILLIADQRIIEYLRSVNPSANYLNESSHMIDIAGWDNKSLTYTLKIKSSIRRTIDFGQHFIDSNDCVRNNLGLSN